MSEPIRVLHIVTQMNIGGIESRLMDLYRAINKSKVQFDFYTLRNEKGFFDDEIISLGGELIYNSPITPLSEIKNRKEFEKYLQTKQYQIIHSHICELSPVLLSVAKKNGIKNRIVHSRHADLTPGIKAIYKQFAKKFIKKYATHYYAVSQKAGYWLFGKEMMRSGQVEIIKNAIDIDKFRYNIDTRKIKREELSIPDDTIVCGLVGSFRYPKNHSFLIEVFYQINKRNSNTLLVLIGNGSDKNKIERKVNAMNLNTKVLFLGERNDVSELLQAIDIFIMPSIYEGMPGASLEAQAAGMPVIMSSNITKEAKISDHAYFISLGKPPELWADEILRIFNDFTRLDSYEDLQKNGYNVNTAAKILELNYLKMAGEHND